MSASFKEIKVRIKSVNAEEQTIVKEILDRLKNETPSIRPEITVHKTKFTPEEVGLMITIGFAAQLSSELAIVFLRKLWNRLKEKNVRPEMEELDQVKNRAENYIRGLGILQFQIAKVQDEGPYVEFNFEDSQKRSHILLISKTDLSVLRYQKMGDN
jgi:hypothetical protein